VSKDKVDGPCITSLKEVTPFLLYVDRALKMHILYNGAEKAPMPNLAYDRGLMLRIKMFDLFVVVPVKHFNCKRCSAILAYEH
jgi:hypothetical protein